MMWLRRDDYWKATSRWQDVNWNEDAFAEFVGVHPDFVSSSIHHTYISMSEEGARRIEQILSPHYRTVIKAYLARKEK